MKVRTFKDVDDNKYVVDINTEDWSEADKESMSDFGEPEIDLGGTYSGTVASITGVVNLNEAGDHNNYGPGENAGTMTITVDGVDIAVVIEDARTSALQMRNSINASIEAAGADLLVTATHDGGTGLVTLSTLQAGAGVALQLTAGLINDVVADAGLLVNTEVNGTGSSVEVLPHKYVSIYRDSPFHYVSDARDEIYLGDARRRAETWSAEVNSKINDAVLALREKSDIFTGEQITNI